MKNRIATIAAPLFLILMVLFSMPVSARTIAGVPKHLRIESSISTQGGYVCLMCNSRATEYKSEWSDVAQDFITICPHCGARGSIYNDGAYGLKGMGLEQLLIYDARDLNSFIDCLSWDYNTYIFDHYYSFYVPGRYILEYVWTTYDPINGTSCDKATETITVYGTVVFDPRGGILQKTQAKKYLTQSARVGKLPKPTRKNYKFVGWYTKRKSGKKISKKTKAKFESPTITYYARWKKIKPKKKKK